MGIIKQTSDAQIIDNSQELITPVRVRTVNDVIDAQVEAAKTSITSLEQNVQTNASNITNIQTDVTNLQTVTQQHTTDITNLQGQVLPSGGTDGQILGRTANGYEWKDESTGSTLPDGTGHHGKFLKTTDEGLVWDTPTVSGAYLPLDGSEAMQGDLDMGGHQLRNVDRIDNNFNDGYYAKTVFFEPDAENDVFIFSSTNAAYFDLRNISGVVARDIGGNVQGEASFVFGQYTKHKGGGVVTQLDLNTNTFMDTDGNPLHYNDDYSGGYNERSLVDKAYVDAQKPAKYVQSNIVLGADSEVRTITHNLNTKDLVVILEDSTGAKVHGLYYTLDPNDQAFDGFNKCRVNFASDETYTVTIIGFPEY